MRTMIIVIGICMLFAAAVMPVADALRESATITITVDPTVCTNGAHTGANGDMECGES